MLDNLRKFLGHYLWHYLWSRQSDPASFDVDKDSGVHETIVPVVETTMPVIPRRLALTRRQKRAFIAQHRPRVPKLLRFCRTSNGLSSGRYST